MSHNLDCYESVWCYQNPDCPLFESCREIQEEEELKFLGNLDNWKPTGLQKPEET